jgi:hypothetical protein
LAAASDDTKRHTDLRAFVRARQTGGLPPSKSLDFETPPTPPSAPQPPVLASRSKDVLNLRWKLPPDIGGRKITEFRLACSPAPAKVGAGRDVHEQGYIVGKQSSRDGGIVRVLSAAERDAAPLPGGGGGGPGEGDGEEWAVVYEGGANVRLHLEGLSPGARYGFRLQAVNVAGPSRWSEECAFNTSAAPPAAPPSAVVTSVGSTSLLLAWRQPDCQVALGFRVKGLGFMV